MRYSEERSVEPMRTRVTLWLLGGALLLVSFTNDLARRSIGVKSELDRLRLSGSIGLNAVAFVTLAPGRVALLLVALVLVQTAGRGARGSTMRSFTICGVRSVWRLLAQGLRPRSTPTDT